MNWKLFGTIVGWGIALYAFFALLRFFENNSANWQRLDRIERMFQELTKKDEDNPKD